MKSATPISNRAVRPAGRRAQRRAGLPRAIFPALLASVAAFAGCNPRVAVTGLVTNVDGEPLPGVSVKVEAAQAFGVTNGNGIFGRRPNILSVPPGAWELEYIKSGFTTAYQNLDTGNARSVEAPPVALWPLPAARGVYLLEGIHYESLTRATPERYRALNGGAVYGLNAKILPEVELSESPVFFVSHKMATYDWQLSRLETARVFRPGVEAPPPGEKIDDSITESIWAAAVRLPIETIPVDLPERLLWQIRPAVAMQPGVYAIHWGALDGDSTTEESVYLIGIQAPEAEAEEGLEEEGGDRAGEDAGPGAGA
ncbi:MAG: carboxypeptidase regulatory-like domain-containing protein [Candidatus Hydrogenedentes bacterium]|nr:carboxypeptidase regulatory-like domain-containing protein [Candidatus Hydrogenedentota bacterium]